MKRRRSYRRLLFVPLFFIIVIILNVMLEAISIERNEEQRSKQERINEQLNSLEDAVQEMNKVLKERAVVRFPSRTSTSAGRQNQTSNDYSNSQCIWQRSLPTNTTLNVRQLYETLPFDNPNGGVWAQGFDIQYNTSQWNVTNKLKIIVVPHSHCDPGWLNTYEFYFQYGSRVILDTMIEMLSANRKYKFIWAEMSFLSLWWDQAKIEQRELLKRLINNGQFEIVTGGWVMNDEANTHYFAMLDQLIEGHQFIATKLGNIPLKSSWANDPFGYSPTMAYLLQASGFENLAIQRVHYHIKKALAKEKNFEFLWQQSWDRDQSTRIFTHMLPFYGYDIPHTCGPDPKICCQFDFSREANSRATCSPGPNPIPITNENLRERAELLIDQYRKKSQLYRTNVLFIPLGDDFRYRSVSEATVQFTNYDQLFNYINHRTDWNVEIGYGTLSDYFSEVFRVKSQEDFPSYTGDFFTYADRDDHYWSGYYTSRAFFKRMDRIAQSYLRATEILFSLAHIKTLQGEINNFFPRNDFFGMLTTARRHLALFQHHDGITGTAADHVVNDYGRKLLDVIGICRLLMQQSAAYLLFRKDYSFYNQTLILNEQFDTFQSLPRREFISLKNSEQTSRVIYIYNPTDQRRKEIKKILLDTHQIRVTGNQQSPVSCQIDPIWTDRRSNIIDINQFELLILVDIEAYSIQAYTIHLTTLEQACPLTNVEYIDRKHISPQSSLPFNRSFIDSKSLIISNDHLSILFSKNGAILHLQHKQLDENIRFHTSIISYSTSKQSDHHSGAYLFIPNGNAQEIPMSEYQFIRIQRGPLVHRLDIIHQFISLRYELSNTHGSNDHTLKIGTLTHLTMNKDTELALRLSTGIKNGDEFFTDLNGFQMIQRKTYEKLPIQGNVYPMASMAYIEDDSMRLTILSGQPSGIACLKSGMLDVFLDRRLTRDDGRGLGQGVLDNRETINTFKLLFELRDNIHPREHSLTGYPTLLAHHLSIELLYPVHLFHHLTSHPWIPSLNFFVKSSILPGDYHLVNLRTLNDHTENQILIPSNRLAFILRRFASDCDPSVHFEAPSFDDFFPSNQIHSIEQTSLSLRHIQRKINSNSKLVLPFAEMVTYQIHIFTR